MQAARRAGILSPQPTTIGGLVLSLTGMRPYNPQMTLRSGGGQARLGAARKTKRRTTRRDILRRLFHAVPRYYQHTCNVHAHNRAEWTGQWLNLSTLGLTTTFPSKVPDEEVLGLQKRLPRLAITVSKVGLIRRNSCPLVNLDSCSTLSKPLQVRSRNQSAY